MRIVNIKTEKYDIFIGRPSKWGNPFIIGVDGSREEVVKKFEDYLLNNNELLDDLEELNGKILGCFCKPLICHGDVLIKILESKKYLEF